MSSSFPITYISELDDRFKYDRRLDILQKIDVKALDLVRKALQGKDLFLIMLVRGHHHLLSCLEWELTGRRSSSFTMHWFYLLVALPHSTLTKWHMAGIWSATSLRFRV
jgi:hypothetical protein